MKRLPTVWEMFPSQDRKHFSGEMGNLSQQGWETFPSRDGKHVPQWEGKIFPSRNRKSFPVGMGNVFNRMLLISNDGKSSSVGMGNIFHSSRDEQVFSSPGAGRLVSMHSFKISGKTRNKKIGLLSQN